MCLDLPRFFLASPFFLPGRFGPSLEKPFISSDHGTREPPRLPSHVMSVTFCFLCRNFAVSFQRACASPPDFNVGVGTGVLPLLCVAYGRPSAHEYGRPWGLLSLDNISRVGFAKIKRRKFAIADRGPPTPPFQCCVGRRAGLLPVGQKSCDLMLSPSASLYWRTSGWSLLHTPRSRF